MGYDSGIPLDQVVMEHITTELGGIVPESLYGTSAGRINIIAE